MEIEEIEVEKAVNGKFAFIDVRTVEEFKDFHIPKAYNVPLFTKKEKELISKIYREKGEREARFEAVKVVSPKIYSIVSRIDEIKKKHENVVVYCWRGGLRSLAVASFCQLAGIFVFRLKGGYRAFRQFILDDMDKILSDKKIFVVYGPTGCGKTKILKDLMAEGFPVLNIEGLAGHRGSVFGGIGLKQPSQKMFDTLVWAALRNCNNSPFIIVEGESKRIGNLYLPDALWSKMAGGNKIVVSMPLRERVKHSLKEYSPDRFPSKIFLSAIKRIERYLPPKIYLQIKESICKKDYEKAIEILMLTYYDKLYGRSMPNTDVSTEINAENLIQLKEKLLDYFKDIH